MLIQKEAVEIGSGINLESISIRTVTDPKDASVLAHLELRASSEVLTRIREGFRSNGRSSVSYHAVERTVQGKEIIQSLLARTTGIYAATFPADWALGVEVREQWPQVDGVLTLKLNGGQETDAVAILLGKVGIRHDYDEPR